MKQKGFTLVELLAVLVILSIMFMLTFPSVNNILSQSKDTVYQTQINNILDASYNLTLKNVNYLPEYNEKTYITLGELKYEGLLDSDIENPNTNEKFKDSLVISVHNVGAGYDYTNKNAKLKGDYLYTVEIDKSVDITLSPTIILTDLKHNSDGNYILTADLNKEIKNITYTAISYDKKDLTNKVKKYILNNDTVVEGIDTSKSGIYKIHYSVVDDKGYANETVLSVIVGDTIPPTITFPKNNTIDKSVNYFDLNAGVSCSDNSEYCDIAISGEIDYGVTGKYIIKYTTKDPNGNTTIKERVITIE